MNAPLLIFCGLFSGALWAQDGGLRVVRPPGDAAEPLATVFLQIRTGSARDPKGLEGLARLTARMVIEGGFGDPSDPVTKERLAEITGPWGKRALPRVRVSKEATTFAMVIPQDKLGEYAATVLGPMFGAPLVSDVELDRLRAEGREALRALRLEQIEAVGLEALDALVHKGDGRAHPALGTMQGLAAVEGRDIKGFIAAYYVPENATLGVAGATEEDLRTIQTALGGMGKTGWPWVPGRELSPPEDDGVSSAVLLALPNALSTGLHAAVPLAVGRGHADYWPLYVANVWFGTHRDSTGRLYGEIREKRGYNYGAYSYMEHFADRPSHLFAPPNAPRRSQYFSLWVRPVEHRYAGHLARAASWEFERFTRGRLTDADCAAAKKKARVLYLSLAQSRERILAARVDDAFYGLNPGWLEGYLEAVDKVDCGEINDAVRRHLSGRALDFVFVTNDDQADALAASLLDGEPVYGKGPAEYQAPREAEIWSIPEDTLEIIRQDAVWAHHDLGLTPGRIRVVGAERLFKDAEVLP